MHEWIAYTYLCNIHTCLCKHTYLCNLEMAYTEAGALLLHIAGERMWMFLSSPCKSKAPPTVVQIAYNFCAKFNYQQLSKTIIPY